MQHEVHQTTQPYYYSSISPTLPAPPQSNNSSSSNVKLLSNQSGAMFNFVIPPQNSQYSSIYGTQTVFPNSNLFSPSSFNSFNQIDSPWLPQNRFIPPGVHSSNSTSDLLGSGRNPFDKIEASNSPSCCGRMSSIETTTTIGMCSPLTAEAYKVVSKEFQSKLDSQSWYCSPSNALNCNSQSLSSCKFSETSPSCSVSLLLLESNDQKQNQDYANDDNLTFESSRNDVKTNLNKENTKNYTSCMNMPRQDLDVYKNELEEKKNSSQSINLSSSNKENVEFESLSTSEESDIIVEESDSENVNSTSDLESDVKMVISSKCLVCNKSSSIDSENDFVKISKEMPVTTSTQVSILSKLSQVINDENFKKLKGCIICPRCLNLINVVDQLEIKLKSAKKELVDIYKSKNSTNDISDRKIEEQQSSDELVKKKLFCDVCNKQFSTINYLEKHKQCHTKVFSYYCEYCGKGFAVLQTLQNHISLHSNSSRFQCELCGKRFIQKNNLTDHIKKHKGEYKYKCGICNKGFIRRSVLKTHMLSHNSESLMCQHCGKQFKNLANLSVHIKICSGDLKFDCIKCDKKFPIKSLLKKHISIRHNSEFHFVCNICKKGFAKKSDLKTHMNSHSENRPFKCSKCNCCYKSLSNLNQHLKVHSVYGVLECKVCGKKFTRQDCLNDHLNQHTGNKPYKCTTCWKTFANRINFNIHIKRHNGTLKQTPCPICGKLFTKGLKDHLTSHSGQKPYSCKHCTAVFTVKSSLNKHIKVKHNNL